MEVGAVFVDPIMQTCVVEQKYDDQRPKKRAGKDQTQEFRNNESFVEFVGNAERNSTPNKSKASPPHSRKQLRPSCWLLGEHLPGAASSAAHSDRKPSPMLPSNRLDWLLRTADTFVCLCDYRPLPAHPLDAKAKRVGRRVTAATAISTSFSPQASSRRQERRP